MLVRHRQRHSVQCKSAWGQHTTVVTWAAGVRSDVHQLALPDLTNGDFQGTASANTPLTSSDRNLIAGLPRRWIPRRRPNGKRAALHLRFGIWRANEKRRVPELTITQAPELVGTSHSCCRGNMSCIPIPHTHTHNTYPRSRDNTAARPRTLGRRRGHRVDYAIVDYSIVDYVGPIGRAGAGSRGEGRLPRETPVPFPRLAPRSHVGVGIGKQGPPSVLCVS